jgi:hypothetical protein
MNKNVSDVKKEKMKKILFLMFCTLAIITWANAQDCTQGEYQCQAGILVQCVDGQWNPVGQGHCGDNGDDPDPTPTPPDPTPTPDPQSTDDSQTEDSRGAKANPHMTFKAEKKSDVFFYDANKKHKIALYNASKTCKMVSVKWKGRKDPVSYKVEAKSKTIIPMLGTHAKIVKYVSCK